MDLLPGICCTGRSDQSRLLWWCPWPVALQGALAGSGLSLGYSTTLLSCYSNSPQIKFVPAKSGRHGNSQILVNPTLATNCGLTPYDAFLALVVACTVPRALSTMPLSNHYILLMRQVNRGYGIRKPAKIQT